MPKAPSSIERTPYLAVEYHREEATTNARLVNLHPMVVEAELLKNRDEKISFQTVIRLVQVQYHSHIVLPRLADLPQNFLGEGDVVED